MHVNLKVDINICIYLYIYIVRRKGHGMIFSKSPYFMAKKMGVLIRSTTTGPFIKSWDPIHPKETCQGIVGCTPGPTYPYGKSLYKPYIVGIYG